MYILNFFFNFCDFLFLNVINVICNIKTRKNATVEYLDMQAAKREKNRHLPLISIYGYVGGRQI